MRCGVLLWLLSACATVQAPVRDEPTVLQRVLPSVVLVVTQRPDGQLGFGSGLVVGNPPRVLTNLHVVADATQVRVLTWQPGRTSYMPQQGGLARFIFENEAALEGARLLRGDPETDLALLEVENGALRSAPQLEWRQTPAVVGERVLALGHPAETVWSFTAGVVSALHAGALQTDAAINPGNSGGPLIDTEGRVLGLNTSRLLGTIHGIGFARPIEMARGLIDGVSSPVKLDRTSPTLAHLTCASAAELASLASVDCMDVESLITFAREVFRRALIRQGVPERDLEARLARNVTTRERAREWLLTSFREAVGLPNQLVLEGDASSRARQQAFLEASSKSRKSYEKDIDAQMLARTGMKIDRRNPHAVLDVLRMGTRVERVFEQGDRAWVEVTGRNTDGSRYKVSELWRRRDDGWREAQTLSAEDEATRPADFALTAVDAETVIERMVSTNLEATRATRALP